ncbi:hypothetical protein M2459_002880 [Parabacteroides sp. PF5-5]|uniref:hypothetical protein n=1 Tax=unclassified Parabacteroides TaxID=2649774 RepID=UPI002476D955|nr:MULTISPECIES: hypothetical protein [unclassified Parabacteroides]MDH6306166.1 hypothetical protein [Parabacteroides sp. PH5-39]MDH6317125.1 hypothetical protein [Parabacteroides sp. PF5-13]MDH6320878.1 hypothetical protein [Parabacteroides sp. PH5-13]MDH6324609.1 hypothetical protein [Parabacteroides sp. PH5-8]MDH6328340.1 hypothetical protein [Parabacteroides sp. PH5-41]
MKKLIQTKIILLLITFVCAVTQVGAKNVYVSETGSGNGTTPSSPVNLTQFMAIFKAHTASDGTTFNAYFAPGTYSLTEQLTLSSGQGGVLFVFDKTPGTTGDVTFITALKSSTNAIGIFKSSTTDKGCNITFRNIIFDGFVGDRSNSYRVVSVVDNGNVVTFDNVTIKRCNIISATARDMFYLSASSSGYHVFISEINIYNSSIIDNNRGAGSGGNILNVRNGNARIYNNTFSGNTASEVVEITYNTITNDNNRLSRGYVAFVNNTVYNSGAAYIANTYARGLFVNNIFAGNSTFNSANSMASYCTNNIIGTSFYATGVSSGSAISDFTLYFHTNLSTELAAGSQHHAITSLSTSNHPIIGKGENIDVVGSKVWDTEGFANLTNDQLGNVRPQNRSIGSIDVNGFKVMDGDIRVYYNSGNKAPAINVPLDTIFKLSNYVLNYPAGLNANNTTFEIISPSNGVLSNGSIAPLTGNTITFTPGGDYSQESTFTFKVSGTDGNRSHEETATVRIRIIDLNITNIGDLPGYEGALDVQCKIDMKQVDFNPRYKFITGAFNNDLITGDAYDNITLSNTDHLGQVYDYHVPLVGDLNGDGRPEIVALGQNTNSGNINYAVTVNAIHIFNGQTGERLLTYTGSNVPSFAPYGDGYHGSPGCMALVDSDRDGKVEVILAVGATSSTSTSKRLFSYVISENNGTWSMAPNPKWTSNPSYSTNNTSSTDLSTPVIQIVDFDGDGKAEILAYNKIFDAETGALLLTYETLNEEPATAGSAYVGRDFKGRESWNRDDKGNSKIGFASVYDIDRDGKYEICAGAKVYYNLNLSTGTYSVLNIMDKLPATEKAWLAGNGTLTGTGAVRAFTDARTAIADIDGDGIPEIVASYYVESNFASDTRTNVDGEHKHGSANKLRIVAWNAHLNKSAPASSEVTLKAILNIPLSNYGTSGTYSYMYIADVDGREQNGKKLPEISMLGPMFYCYLYGNSWTSYPIHPNVADKMATSYPRTGGPTDANRAKGSLISFTWDNTPGISVFDRLKVSFMMEHSDVSVNTGISLFDFDNDGINEICYRDEKRLRIIRPIQPFVSLNDDTGVTLFEKNVESNTGFEYPVIVDLDGDYSVDMLVSGAESNSTRDFLYAVQGANVDLAPARTVWNQFMYSPMKIDENLQVPLSFPPHPLSPGAAFYQDANDEYETPIYNMNIGQVPYYSIFDKDGKSIYKPLVKTPDAIIKNPKFNGNNYIEFILSNAGEAAMNANTPIKAYEGETASASNIYGSIILGRPLYPGESTTIRIPLKNTSDVSKTFLIRVADDSFEGLKGDVWRTEQSSFKDCDWNTNEDILSAFYLKDDYYTLLTHETSLLDILGNDILTVFEPSIPTLDQFTITKVSGDAVHAIVNNRLRVTTSGMGGLSHFTYSITHLSTTLTGDVYVYTVELESPNTLLCDGQPYTLKALAKPAGTTFQYFGSNNVIIDGATEVQFTASKNTPQVSYYVKPIFNNVPGHQALSDYFPRKKVEFKVADVITAFSMKWTGAVDTDWHNPGNWVEVSMSTGQQYPVSYIPSACVNVIIPSGLAKYPILTKEAACYDITMEDRAMIAGIHYLSYENASVELKLTSSEKDRFVMWSAPLKSMYSGDYHYKNTAGTTPQWGDVYMNLFQYDHPSGTTAATNSFTATFGDLDESLQLGKAFNLKVTSTSNNKDKTFKFPQTATQYVTTHTTPNKTYNTPRNGNGSKFIVDKTQALNGTRTFLMDVLNDVAGSDLVQIVNPYMAYLDVVTFLNNNTSSLSPTFYGIWDGKFSSSFEQIGTVGDPDHRYIIKTNEPLANYSSMPGLIPPLQSFFVQKKSGTTTKINSVYMSPDWTTTNGETPYTLRGDAAETNVLRIKASQNGNTSYAVLHYNESTVPAFNAKEDMFKIFYDEIPVEVYSLAPTREALAINSSNDFQSTATKLGLRVKDAGQVTFYFSGMETFGYNVYLIDHALNNKQVDIKANPSYTFTVTKASASDKVIELNDRFSLSATYTGIGVGNEDVSADGLKVSAQNGYIYVQAPSAISSLQVYNVAGALVYNSNSKQTYYRIPADEYSTYIVKAKVGDEYLVEKVFVK